MQPTLGILIDPHNIKADVPMPILLVDVLVRSLDDEFLFGGMHKLLCIAEAYTRSELYFNKINKP